MRTRPHSPVQHLGAGPFQLLQDLWELRVVITGRAPAQHTSQVISGTEWQHSQLTLAEHNGEDKA